MKNCGVVKNNSIDGGTCMLITVVLYIQVYNVMYYVEGCILLSYVDCVAGGLWYSQQGLQIRGVLADLSDKQLTSNSFSLLSRSKRCGSFACGTVSLIASASFMTYSTLQPLGPRDSATCLAIVSSGAGPRYDTLLSVAM